MPSWNCSSIIWKLKLAIIPYHKIKTRFFADELGFPEKWIIKLPVPLWRAKCHMKVHLNHKIRKVRQSISPRVFTTTPYRETTAIPTKQHSTSVTSVCGFEKNSFFECADCQVYFLVSGQSPQSHLWLHEAETATHLAQRKRIKSGWV